MRDFDGVSCSRAQPLIASTGSVERAKRRKQEMAGLTCTVKLHISACPVVSTGKE